MTARRAHLDCASENVAVVGEPCGEGRAVKEHVLLAPFCALQLLLERIDFGPKFKDMFLLFRKVEVLALNGVLHGRRCCQEEATNLRERCVP